MAYSMSYAINLGANYAGLSDLRAQLVDTSGVASGSAISSGFTAIGSGSYIWYYTGFADGFRGGVKFYSNAAPSTVLAFAAVNPEDGEYLAIDLANIGQIVWNYARRTLTIPIISTAASANPTDFDLYVTVTLENDFAVTIPATWDKLYFTMKTDEDDADSAAVAQVVVTNGGDAGDGLIVLNGEASGLTATDASLVADEVNDIVTLTLKDELTADIAKGRYYYDLKCVLASGASSILISGKVVAKQSITRKVS